jgi:hypothetical protein
MNSMDNVKDVLHVVEVNEADEDIVLRRLRDAFKTYIASDHYDYERARTTKQEAGLIASGGVSTADPAPFEGVDDQSSTDAIHREPPATSFYL